MQRVAAHPRTPWHRVSPQVPVVLLLMPLLLLPLLLLLQTGIPVLGVVENMSGLRQPLSAFKFWAPGGQDITAAVLRAAATAAADAAATGTAAAANGTAAAQPNSAAAISSGGGEVMAETAVFHAGGDGGGAQRMASDMAVPFLGRVPLDPALGRACEEGRSIFEEGAAGAGAGAGDGGGSAAALQAIIDRLLAATAAQPLPSAAATATS